MVKRVKATIEAYEENTSSSSGTSTKPKKLTDVVSATMSNLEVRQQMQIFGSLENDAYTLVFLKNALKFIPDTVTVDNVKYKVNSKSISGTKVVVIVSG